MIGTRPAIRLATENDLDVLVDIRRQARDSQYRAVVPDEALDDPAHHAEIRDRYAAAIGSSGRALFCAERDGEVVGFASLGPPVEPVVDADPAAVGQLVSLYVAPRHWAHGIGSVLHEESIRRWQAAGVIMARLELWDRNEHARAFLRRRGWRPDGYRRPGRRGGDVVRLCRTVPPSLPDVATRPALPRLR